MDWEAKGSSVFEGRNCIGICDTDNASQRIYEKRAKIMAASEDMIEALLVALPYVEDAEKSEDFKPGTVRKHIRQVRAALVKAGAA